MLLVLDIQHQEAGSLLHRRHTVVYCRMALVHLQSVQPVEHRMEHHMLAVALLAEDIHHMQVELLLAGNHHQLPEVDLGLEVEQHFLQNHKLVAHILSSSSFLHRAEARQLAVVVSQQLHNPVVIDRIDL